MNRLEYEMIQERLLSKIKKFDKPGASDGREDAYNRGILDATAIIRNVYERQED